MNQRDEETVFVPAFMGFAQQRKRSDGEYTFVFFTGEWKGSRWNAINLVEIEAITYERVGS